jgi:hypothetical protein
MNDEKLRASCISYITFLSGEIRKLTHQRYAKSVDLLPRDQRGRFLPLDTLKTSELIALRRKLNVARDVLVQLLFVEWNDSNK